MSILFFEDNHISRFHPLTLTRPLDDLRVGILTLADKWMHETEFLGFTFSRVLRSSLIGVFSSNHVAKNEEILFINPRFFPTKELVRDIKRLRVNEGISSVDHVDNDPVLVAYRWKSPLDGEIKAIPDLSSSYIQEQTKLASINRIWDLFLQNSAQIEQDISRLQLKGISANASISKYAIIDGKNIFIEDGAIIEAGAILLAEDAPIYIGKDAHIMAGAILRGHVAIGTKSQVKMSAKLYENTSIGPVCKVGGEISSSIFHSYSNKSHDGFVGNSIIGQWCNFGADSNTSNLKNNYSTVRFADWESKKLIDSERQFLGTIMGDHSKTAINTMLNTGTICGVSCNLFSSGFPMKYVPSFRWLDEDSTRIYDFDKAIEVAERVMNRRAVPITTAYISMMKDIYDGAVYE